MYIIHYKIINFVSQMTDSNKESSHIEHPSLIGNFLREKASDMNVNVNDNNKF